MTKGEIKSLYCEVEKLLQDICRFINDEISTGHISPSGRTLASTLIERSKRQLQTIAVTINSDGDGTNESYVDMQGCKVNQDPNDMQEVYSDVSISLEFCPSPDEEYITCPYINLPACETKENKSDYLFKQDRFFFVNKCKKVFASVQPSWLLIYANKNAAKPCETINLAKYKVKSCSAAVKHPKKRTASFELVSVELQKSYYFIAETAKDMMQWVASINKYADKSVVFNRGLPPVPTIIDSMADDSDSLNEYEPLKQYQHKDRKIEKPPTPLPPSETNRKQSVPLPPRNITRQSALCKEPSEESLCNYDVVLPVQVNNSVSLQSSFSDDDSDENYDNPMALKTTEAKPPPPPIESLRTNNDFVNKSKSVSLKTFVADDQGDENYDNPMVLKTAKPPPPPIEEDEIYDYLEKPVWSASQNSNKSTKPAIEPKPKSKLLSFKSRRTNHL